ncbi:MAG: ATP-binding protein [Gammaproteobacteria bacterium]|nr:ATP-binding protein [Gammaproteobacteria bacterium]MDH5240897.1 ATP-binding protein [Gammaproteobacteria bacterium]MDH5261888.1 ATP-binding protein [Gammaproteobacteria bacterium]MDH5618997.1 ATP-binding protein [Gammaproteobacteria bacterium]
MQHRRTILLAVVAIVLIAGPVAADPWYEYYTNAQQALEREDWTAAVQQLNAALEKKGDSSARARSYGMNVVEYFPYFRLGVAYYHLGQFDAALQAFETEARLGAITESESANAQLAEFRVLAEEARLAQVAERARRIENIVADSLAESARLKHEGQIEAAIAAVDKALAVAPENVDALATMQQLRETLARQQREREIDHRVSQLVEEGRALLGAGDYEGASSVLGEAHFLQPDPEIQALLDRATRRLQDGAAPDRSDEDIRLRERRYAEQQAAEVEARIEKLLVDASNSFEAGATEASLAAANQVLALNPGNPAALEQIARAYAVINRRLLGTRPGGNIPPALRFVDLREEDEDGQRLQIIRSPDFRLTGIVIDESPVEVSVYSDDGEIEPTLNSQSLGDFTLTEFSVEVALAPGMTSLWLLASDAGGMNSGTEYSVLYVQPLLRDPRFQALLLLAAGVAIAVPLWRGNRRRTELRRRKFNPYVAGAPVMNDDMFFGRRQLVARILQTIHNNSLLLYGERRIGKTSIQHQLKRRLLDIDDPHFAFYPVYIDLQGTPQEQFFWTIARDIAEELAPTLDGLAITESMPSDYGYRDLLGDLRLIITYLQEKSPKTAKLVLLIDEVDELNEYDPRINQRLRSLFMKNFAENLVAVVSGVEIKKRWEREGSPWYNFFEEIEVRPFDEQEARDLIRKPIEGIFKADTDVIERIIGLTGGRPYLIQKLCVALVTRLHEERRRKMTVADVDAVAGVR